MSTIESTTSQEADNTQSTSHRHKRHSSLHHRSSRGEHRIRGERQSHSSRSSTKKTTRRNRPCKKMRAFWEKVVQALVLIIHLVTDVFLEYTLGWYLGDRKRCPPPTSNDSALCTKSAVELAKLVRDRKVKAYDLVKCYIDRIREVNPVLNAVVDGPFLEALDEAKQIDDKIASGQITDKDFAVRPFLGVPFTTKDSTSVKGKLHTLGLVARRNERSNSDAECVHLLKKAGGIIIATTNVPEVNRWSETRNNLIGTTNNPYDTRRSVGGSSGGEAALVSACATGVGLGTDIGGSIRIPAFNCGVFGHKPTEGAINTKGCTFRTGKEPSTMVVVGPIARYSIDLLHIFRAIVEPTKAEILRLDEEIDLKKLKYFYIPSIESNICNPVNQEMQSTMFRIIRYFTELTGEEVKEASIPDIHKSYKMWRYGVSREPASFGKLLGNGVLLNPIFELAKKACGRSDYTMAAIYSLLDTLRSPGDPEVMENLIKTMSDAFAELLNDNGVLFFHSAPRTAPFHYYNLFKIFDFTYFNIFNVVRLPVTQVPMGLDSKGMPLGIQVVAGKNCDRLCFAVAQELERVFGGWVPPFQSN